MNNNNSDDFLGKTNPQIEVDPVTGKITIKDTKQQTGSQTSQGNKNDKKSQQSRKKLIEPHHSPDDARIEEEKEKKLTFIQSLSQKLSGNNRNSTKNLEAAQNIGNRLNKLGVKFLGHLSTARINDIPSQPALNTKVTGKDADKDKGI